jgi:hypothetical protein
VDLTIDHTLSWEIARVGGLLAYVLATASVSLGILLSLKATSPRWPRFITTELHRFVTVLTLVFIGIHTAAVLVDPFTGFTPSEVLVPFAAHYRPLWIGLGVVSGYLAVAVWASEYIRKRIGYAWWRRFHYAAFVVFVLGALHGLGAGSDSQQGWALGLYAVTVGTVAILLGWRLVRALGPGARDVALASLAAGVVALGLFGVVGPAQAGWNETANNGNGNGASAAWLAAHPTVTAAAPTSSFSAELDAALVDEGVPAGSFHADEAPSGSLQLVIRRGSAGLSLSFADGWTCSGEVAAAGEDALVATCAGGDGARIAVELSQLRRTGTQVIGRLDVTPTG